RRSSPVFRGRGVSRPFSRNRLVRPGSRRVRYRTVRFRNHPPDAHRPSARRRRFRSEEHTSELQSRENLVCRLLLEKKKQLSTNSYTITVINSTGGIDDIQVTILPEMTAKV